MATYHRGLSRSVGKLLIPTATSSTKKRPVKKTRKANVYVVMSIRGNEEFEDGTYARFSDAMKVARRIDSYLTVRERRDGHRTEVWTNPDAYGTIQTVHVIRPRRK